MALPGGDPDDLRGRARAVRGWADDAESEVGRVLGATGVEWVSTAADRFRARLLSQAEAIRQVAEALDAGAERLDHLAGSVEGRQQHLRRLLAPLGGRW